MSDTKKYNRKKTVGVYKITNTVNNKVYIGASKNIESRIQAHKANSKKRKNEFYNDIRKFGYDKFKKEIIETCILEELDKKEIFWINEYRKTCEVYNVLDGGKSGYKRQHSEETKAKISKSLTGKPSTKSTEEREKARILLTKKNPKSKKVVCENVVYDSIASLAKKLKINKTNLSKRIKGIVLSEKIYFDMKIHFLGERNNMILKQEIFEIECDLRMFKNTKECSDFFNLNIDTLRCYLSGRRTMPLYLKKINLRRIQ